jgi:hypothetical protein
MAARQRRRLEDDGGWSFAEILRSPSELDDMGMDELEQLYDRSQPDTPQPSAASAAPPDATADAAIIDSLRQRLCPEAASSDVPFLLSRADDSVPDVGRWLSAAPAAVIDDLAANQPRAFLTEPPETTNARTPLTLFENHTRCLRGSTSADWFRRLAPWAGTVVDTLNPDADGSPALCRTWRAADNQRRAYTLGVFRQMDAFYVVVVLASDDGAPSRYVGAFYMQSTLSHRMDLEPQ